MASRAGGTVLYLAAKILFGAGARMPLALSRFFGARLGTVALATMRSSSQRIRRHLEIAFPEVGHHEVRRLTLGCARHFGLMLAEVAWLHRARSSQVERLCRISGVEHLRSALDDGRGAMLTTAHCGNWELLNARLPVAAVPLTIAVRRLDDPRLDRMVTSLRCRFGTEVVPRGETAGRVLARALASNRVDGLLIDQDIRDVPGVFVPFFGRPAWTPSGAAMLAIRLRAPVIPGFIHRLPDGTHEATIHPPLPIPTDGSLEDRVQELTAAATAAIEAQIRAYPEQWVWMHRRWRTRPEDETSTDS